MRSKKFDKMGLLWQKAALKFAFAEGAGIKCGNERRNDIADIYDFKPYISSMTVKYPAMKAAYELGRDYAKYNPDNSSFLICELLTSKPFAFIEAALGILLMIIMAKIGMAYEIEACSYAYLFMMVTPAYICCKALTIILHK